MRLELYHLNECPYSKKVRDYLEETGLKENVQYHEIETESGALDRLESISGSTQVPCLVVDGQPILESDAIIEFLEEHRDEMAA